MVNTLLQGGSAKVLWVQLPLSVINIQFHKMKRRKNLSFCANKYCFYELKRCLKISCELRKVKGDICLGFLSRYLSVPVWLLCQYVNVLNIFDSLATSNTLMPFEILSPFLKTLGICNFKLASNVNDVVALYVESLALFYVIKRSAVICLVGHVDHGKTTFLDYMRSSNLAVKEFGNITQKMSSYVLNLSGQFVSFIDTPGHSLFDAMRLRATSLSDVLLLLVSATEPLKPQALEILNLVKRENMDCVIAVNKIDLLDKNSVSLVVSDLEK